MSAGWLPKVTMAGRGATILRRSPARRRGAENTLRLIISVWLVLKLARLGSPGSVAAKRVA
jgi:hypothetical protein